MLLLAHNLWELSFGSLMEIYIEGNLENAQEFWPDESRERQMALAEQEFYQYLQQVFFQTPGAVYAIWQVNGVYVSALRLEPYRDGLLLEALETAPEQRQRGYAKALMQAVLEQMGNQKIYSHVGKHNIPSLRTHEACGFWKTLDHAVYADGSVNQRSFTLCHE